MLDVLKHNCGVFGIYNNENASWLTYLGLYALQHRGQESAGMVSYNGEEFFIHKGMGLVNDVFNEASIEQLRGRTAIGHVRYSTMGSSMLKNVQPMLIRCIKGEIAIAHNGNLVNAPELRTQLEKQGSIFQTTVDSEIIVHLIAKSKEGKFLESLIDALKKIRGAYSLVLMTGNELVGVRDPYGFRPLCIGEIGDGFVLASESCVLDLIGANFVREVNPGEIVIINEYGLKSIQFDNNQKRAMCIFEHIYFSRPDSIVFGENVNTVRQKLGRLLAIEHPVKADLVSPIPDSGVPAAIGFSMESGIQFQMGFIRNHYIGRTFIQPNQFIRNAGVKIKLNPIRDLLADKSIVVVDDSIVRGTTSRKIMKMLYKAGASAIHVRISSPPIKYSCFYGIDTPSRKELIASTHSVEEIKKFIGVDSIGYLSKEGLLDAVSFPNTNYCTACFDGNYPVEISGKTGKSALES